MDKIAIIGAALGVFLGSSVAQAETPSPDAPPPEWGVAGPYVLDVHVILGSASRLDDPPLFEQTRPIGLLVGGGLGLTLSRRIALGLTYEYTDLGTERSHVSSVGIASISRATHNVWLDLSAFVIRGETVGVYLSVAAGFAVQQANLTASYWSAVEPGKNLSVRCSGGGDFGFGVRGAAGMELFLDPVRLIFDAGVANQRLGDEPMDDCVPGAGTATVLGLRGAMGYAFDL